MLGVLRWTPAWFTVWAFRKRMGDGLPGWTTGGLGLPPRSGSGAASMSARYTGLLSNQGEKSIHFFFISVPLRKK